MQGAAMAIKVARVALEYGMLLWLISCFCTKKVPDFEKSGT